MPDNPKDWRYKHGYSRHPMYGCWKAMMDRCYDRANHAFPHYGGRGITVCPEWHNIAVFIRDMGPKPSKRHSLDRFPDNDGPYCPANCRWATDFEQQRNRRSSRMVTAFGETMHIHEWSERFGVPAQTIWARIKKRGKTPEVAVTAPAKSGPWKTEESPV